MPLILLSGYLWCAATLPKTALVEGYRLRAWRSTTRALLQSSEDSPEKTRFVEAVYKGDVDGVRKALDQGVDVDTPIKNGYSALHIAASNGDTNMVSELLSSGADPDAKANQGTSALHLAARHGDEMVAALLIQYSADVDVKDSRGFTPLHFSAYGDMSQEYVREDLVWVDGAMETRKRVSGDQMIAPKDSLLANFKNGKIPNHIAVLSLLLMNGADFDATTEIGESPLHYVSSFDRYQAALLLISYGANIEITDVQGERPLHEAVAYGAKGVTEALLVAGADTYAKEMNGLDAREFICRCRSYHGSSSLTPCGPGMCMSTLDRLVLESMIDSVRHS